MSGGRGKGSGKGYASSNKSYALGGKGIGKGGAQRHKKIFRDNIQGITKPVCDQETGVYFMSHSCRLSHMSSYTLSLSLSLLPCDRLSAAWLAVVVSSASRVRSTMRPAMC